VKEKVLPPCYRVAEKRDSMNRMDLSSHELLKSHALATAKPFASDFRLVELQGVTLHRHHTRVVAIYALMGGAVGVLSILLPIIGGLLCLALALSAAADIRGGRGWVRNLLLRDSGLNLLLWKTRGEEGEGPVDRPKEFLRVEDGQEQGPPRLVIGLPLTQPPSQKTRKNSQRALMAVGLTTLAFPLLPILTLGTIALWLSLFLISLGILGLFVLSKPKPVPIHNGALLPKILGQIGQLSHSQVLVALVDSGFGSDALSTLLRNFKSYLPNGSTEILYCEPDSDELHVLLDGGPISHRPQNSSLGEAVAELSTQRGSTLSQGALHYGWNAFTLRGALDTEQGWTQFCRLLQTFDEAPRE
jgi:hypothetical protein